MGHLIGLMYLGEEVGAAEGNDFAVLRGFGEVLPVPHGRGLGGVVLQTADHVRDQLVLKHLRQQGRVVDEEQRLEDIVEVVEAVRVIQVLAHAKEVEQLWDVAVLLYRERQALALDWGGGVNDTRHQLLDLLQVAELTWRQLD